MTGERAVFPAGGKVLIIDVVLESGSQKDWQIIVSI